MNESDASVKLFLHLAATSLYWPRQWKEISGFFEGVFGWIFSAGEKLFSLYLKLAAVWIVAYLTWRTVRRAGKALKAPRSRVISRVKAVLAYPAFAVSVLALVSSVFMGLYVILNLGGNEPISDKIISIVFLVLLVYFHLSTKAFYRRHRPGKRASANDVPAGRPIRREAGASVD